MIEIVAVVDRLLPGLLRGSRASVACVCTTRPKYLVFDDDPRRPACVVDFGSQERLLRADHVLSELQPRLPGVVPRSLCCAPWHNGTYVHVQEGLAGVPWFRVSDGMATAADWQRLVECALDVMQRMHAAVRQVPQWTGAVDLQFELDRQAHIAGTNGLALSHQAAARIGEWSAALGSLGPLPGVAQHGDFSVNNLLVSPDSLAVIDIDEFGDTLVPLQDAFGLALSLTLSQPHCSLSRRRCIALCVHRGRRDARIGTAHLPGLLMHHLLWRINQCHGLDRRRALSRVLASWVEKLAADPGSFFGEVL